MDGNYPPGFYCPERNQQERHSQQHQQHVTPYPMDLPYHPTSQHQPEFAVDQPLRPFPAPHTGPGLSMLSSIYHDSSPVLPNPNTVHPAHHQLPATIRDQRVKSTTQPASYAPLLTTHPPHCENITQGQQPIPPAPSKRLPAKESIKDSEIPSSQQNTHAPAPNSSNTSNNEPSILAALNLKKNRKISSSPELPQGLSYKWSVDGKVEGVLAKGTVEKGSEFGPYTGSLMNEEQGLAKDSTWEICISGQVFFYLDGRKTWMSQVRCAQSEEEQNLEAYQFYGEIYFRNTKVIEPGSELKVFYNAEYAKRVGIHTKLNELTFNQDTQKFQCTLCEDQFSSAKLILRHMRCEHSQDRLEELYPVLMWKRKKSKKPLETDIPTQEDLTVETQVNKEGELVYQCGTCEKSFSCLGKLKEHESFHKFSKGHTCPICDKKEINSRTLAKHMKTHEPLVLKCNECNRTYKTRAGLRKHRNEFHGHQCKVCFETFPYKADFKKHEQTHKASSKNGPHTGKKLIDAAMPEEPKDMLGKTTNYYLRPFKCRYCPKRYSLRSSVRTHEKEQHTGDVVFKCPHCPKIFGNEYRLIDHLRSHEENRMYRCTLCPKTFGSESALNNHQGEHNGLKPFSCDICGRGFRIKKAVQDHKRRIHRTQKMRFFCSVCNKGFADKGNFTKHERRHKGVRPYVCLQCGKGFTAKHVLNTHIKAMHTEKKDFSCNICGKTFSLNQNYTYHMFRHKEQGDISSKQT
ncbi:zinc finger protein 624-like [Lytechinus variegatus]|uniref:zinc finger protein 624-like n=1 Tax=Lytechinus variegatus TaxID=7654 RepID=UPI001BB25768|nr:zinc finger protein 624-like [Lytechinus variegatus]XP_041470864.1 zinc finger protein 624-like [Lytechinus variegatus]XP_041470865.1 zinc finger protein 624-like [Lytechinus variegatus]